jgi:hypothetical protein
LARDDRNRGLDHPRAVAGEYLVECRGGLAVPVADHELEAACALTEVHEQVTGLLRPGPAASGGARGYLTPSMKVGTARPPITPGRAALLTLLACYVRLSQLEEPAAPDGPRCWKFRS